MAEDRWHESPDFLDIGANTHLVQGKMAVAAGFEITSSCPTSLTIVGGGNLKTEVIVSI